jgi:GT2 family glycosyltransferase
VNATIIIPFHRNLGQLEQSLSAARRSMQNAEIVIAADGATEDCRPLCREHGARLIEIPGPSGPAVARNRGAAVATGDVLLFVDTDVVVAPDALAGMCRFLEEHPAVAGVFGAYDLAPPETDFLSQYKNLSHAYVHEQGNRNASTFWAGLGAIRTDVFRSVGGFDERFRRPSVEDIELGYRVVAAGHTLRLEPRFRGKHLKRWTLVNSITTEIGARGVPWTQLIHRFRALNNDLNLGLHLRLSVVAAYLVAASALLAFVTPWALVSAIGGLAALVLLNAAYYRWFLEQRGALFAMRVVPAHLVHHLCNGVSVVVGTLLHLARRIGVALPGSLPATTWGQEERPMAGPAVP